MPAAGVVRLLFCLSFVFGFNWFFNSSTVLVRVSIFCSITAWFAKSFALSALRMIFSSRTLVYFSVSRSMDFCNSARKSLLRCLREANQVTTEPKKPPGSEYVRRLNRKSIVLLI